MDEDFEYIDGERHALFDREPTVDECCEALDLWHESTTELDFDD